MFQLWINSASAGQCPPFPTTSLVDLIGVEGHQGSIRRRSAFVFAATDNRLGQVSYEYAWGDGTLSKLVAEGNKHENVLMAESGQVLEMLIAVRPQPLLVQFPLAGIPPTDRVRRNGDGGSAARAKKGLGPWVTF